MRVIKHGDRLLYREQEHECTQCGCKFKYTLADVENYIDYQQEDKEFISKIYVKCPECHLAFFIEPAAATPEDPQPSTDEPEPVDPGDVNPDPVDPEPVDPDGGD